MSGAKAAVDPPGTETVEPPPAAKRGRLVLIVAAVVIVALAGGGWFLAPRVFGGVKPAAAPVPPPAPVKATVALGSVIVNLNGEARRYLRVGVSLGVAAPGDVKEIEETRSQLLDLLIAVFSASEVEALASDEGKTTIKTTLLHRMREELHLHKVSRVYFTEFVIQ